MNEEPSNHENDEIYISVDVETSGPIPSKFSLLSIGACLVYNDEVAFSCFVKPAAKDVDPAAMQVTGLSIRQLEQDGLEPRVAMERFATWVAEVVPEGNPVFVGLNAGFDWSFVNFYFHTYLGTNPFGFAPLDIKSLYMGAMACSWNDTKSSRMNTTLQPSKVGDHNALNDARAQAELFRLILDKQLNRRK